MGFTPGHPIPAVLGLLGAGAVALLAAGAMGLAVLLRRGELARKILLGALGVGALYLVVLLGVSLASEEKVLAPGEWKYFCEVDCHLAYTVTGVQKMKTLGAAGREATAAGTFWLVTVKTWFDEETIHSARARGMPLWPNARKVRVVDAAGKYYPMSLAGQAVLEAQAPAPAGQARTAPLCQPLRPGEAYETQIVFDLPEGVQGPRLLLTTADLPAFFVIGHESSPLHKKISFRLAS